MACNGEAMDTTSEPGSFFSTIDLAEPDGVFGLTGEFKACTAPKKVNLIIGAYRTSEGEPYVLPVVRSVEKQMATDETLNHEYLPIEGMQKMCEVATNLALGAESPALTQNRVCSVQALSGTGALRLAFEFTFQNLKESSKKVCISKPTWGNHKKILLQAGYQANEIMEYRYYNSATKGLDLSGMLADLGALEEGTIVLLHTCAHNPSGVDPTQEEWKEICKVVVARKLLPVFDTAYQGFVTGCPDTDAWSLRYFVSQGLNLICCSSFAKIFGLYNERCGNVFVVCSNSTEQMNVKSQLKAIVRPMYSNPPHHGARIVATILANPALKSEWLDQLKQMANRIEEARKLLHGELSKAQDGRDWSHIMKQRGMFTYTGLQPDEVAVLKQEHHIYMLPSGRISMCGITPANVEDVANAIRKVIGQ